MSNAIWDVLAYLWQGHMASECDPGPDGDWSSEARFSPVSSRTFGAEFVS